LVFNKVWPLQRYFPTSTFNIHCKSSGSQHYWPL
jgi:hypothetical protein